MEFDPNSLALGAVIGLGFCVLMLLVGAYMYADALANGRVTEAGMWAWLSSLV